MPDILRPTDEQRERAQAAAARIAAAQAAVLDATAVLEQTIRDEVSGEKSITIAGVARALGVQNRGRIYAILGQTAGRIATPPARTPTVYLRGGGISQAAWDRIEAACWARRWTTTHSRTDAWHLARGGDPVAIADFTLGYDDLLVGRVEAKYRPSPTGDDEQALELVRGNGRRYERPVIGTGADRHLDEHGIALLLARHLPQGA